MYKKIEGGVKSEQLKRADEGEWNPCIRVYYILVPSVGRSNFCLFEWGL